MKLALTALATLALAAANPQNVNAQSPTPSQTTVEYIDTLLDAAIEDLRQTLAETGGTRADFRRMSNLLRQRAEAALQQAQQSCNVQGRLDDAMEELMDSWGQAVLSEQHVVDFQEDMIQVRMDEAISELLNAHPVRLAQPGAFDALRTQVQAQANVVMQSSTPVPNFTARLDDAVQQLEDAASQHMIDYDHWVRFHNAQIDVQLSSALNRLQRRLAGAGGTRSDYRRISRQMINRANAARNTIPEPCE